MPFKTLLDGKTVLRNITVKLGSFELLIDDVITMEFNHSIDKFGIFGHVTVKDTYDFNNSGLVDLNGDSLLHITMMDFSGNQSKRTYRILKIEASQTDHRFKVFTFILQDEISFILDNTYLSKSFTKTPIQALLDCLTHVGIDSLISSDLLKIDSVDTTSVDNFAIPQNVSLLSFFKRRLMQENVHFFQDRSGIHIKPINITELTLKQNSQGVDILYSNNSSNSQYLYLIHDYVQTKNNIELVGQKTPNSRIFRLNSDKIISDVTKNPADVMSQLSTNTHAPIYPKMQELYKTQVVPGTQIQEFNLFNSLTSTNMLKITVPGDVKNANAGTLINLDLKGNILNTDSTNKGDVNTGGKYLIKAVSDRIITDKLIHKYTLIRVDSRTPR